VKSHRLIRMIYIRDKIDFLYKIGDRNHFIYRIYIEKEIIV